MKILVYIFLFITVCVQAQESLQIRRVRFNHLKKIELSRGDILEYKLKGEPHYRKNEIVGLHDSVIDFPGGYSVTLNQVKWIKLHKQPRLSATLKKLLIYAGLGYLIVDTSNNLIFNRTPEVNEKSVYFTLYCLSGALLLEELLVKRIKINQRNSLKIIDANYFQFNTKAP